ncbi:HAAS domain-containing protein [Peribacillus muralis]|uniref:HAAS domain-containing protein n=1 Tax=Peribacillus muralis TaxID=264697 RepID=UPI0037FB821B
MNTPLSKDSQHFLGNLRLYLVANGKNSDQIEEIIEELEVHLFEAESNDNSVEHIVGSSPQEYMKQISVDMPADYRGWLKYIVLILFGAFSYWVIDKALNGGIEFTVIEIMGFPFAGILSLLIYRAFFKYMASKEVSIVKQSMLLFVMGMVSIGLFAGLLLLSEVYQTPLITFNDTGNVIAVMAAVFLFILISLWSKTWISIIIPILLFGPALILDSTDYQESVKLVLSSLITMLGILLYCGITLEKLKSV